MKKTATWLVLISLLSTGIVVMLFAASQQIIHHRNNFVRRFSDQVHQTAEADLKFNSFYFAGTADGKLYLGNFTAPLRLTVIDLSLENIRKQKIKLDRVELPFRSVEVHIQKPYFFVTDGTVPCVFRGKLGAFSANQLQASFAASFSHVQILDSVTIAYTTSDKNGESILGTTRLENGGGSHTNPSLLQKQIDGNFDLDGTLRYDDATGKLVYLYLYRNQFIISNPDLSLDYRGKTIDTISKAQIRITKIGSSGDQKLSAPPLIVNKTAAVHRGLLFVNSGLIGRYEQEKLWDQAKVIDVYALSDGSYIASFYIYHIGKQKMRSIFVQGNMVYALIGEHIAAYRLTPMITKHFSNN